MQDLMADNDNLDSFLNGLEKIENYLPAAARNTNYSISDTEHSTPVTTGDDSGRNSSSSNRFSQEQGVGSSPLETFITQSCEEIPPLRCNPLSDSHDSTQKSNSKTSEDNRENCFLVTVEDYGGRDGNHPNTHRYFSLQESEGLNPTTEPHKKPAYSNPVADWSGFNKEENQPSGYFRKRNLLDSTSFPQISMEADRNKAKALKELRGEITSASAGDNEMSDFLSGEISNSVVLCSVDSKGVPVAEPSTFQKNFYKTGNDEPFVCDVCGKNFVTRNYFEVHKRTHTSDKPFVCKICDRGFSKKINLTRHLLTHTGEKPFECKECDRKFSQSNNYRRHIKSFHGRN